MKRKTEFGKEVLKIATKKASCGIIFNQKFEPYLNATCIVEETKA